MSELNESITLLDGKRKIFKGAPKRQLTNSKIYSICDILDISYFLKY